MHQTTDDYVTGPATSRPLPLEPEVREGHASVIALIGGATAMMLLAGMTRLKLIALFLGPVGMGIAGVIDPTAQLAVQIGALNIPTAALRFLSIATDEDGARGFAWLYRTLLRLILMAATLSAAVALAVFLIWPRRTSASIGAYTLALALCLAAVPLTSATNYIRNVLSTLRRYRAAGAAIAVSSVLLVASTYVGLRSGGLAGAYLGGLLVASITVIALHLLVVPTLRKAPVARSGSLMSLLKAHPDIVAFSMTMYAIGFAVPLSYWVVRWVVFGHLGERETGFLTAAYAIAAGLRAIFSQASAQYLIPLTSRHRESGAHASDSARYIRTLMLLLLAAGLPLVLFPHELIVTLYSRAFLPAIAVIGLFILAELIMSLGDTYRVMLLGLDDLRGCLVMTYSSAGIIIAGSFWVIPRFGLPGAALLQLGTGVLVLLWSYYRLGSRHDIRVEARTLALTAYVILALGIAVAIGRFGYAPSASTIAAKAAMAAGLLLGGIAILPLLERQTMLALVKRGTGNHR